MAPRQSSASADIEIAVIKTEIAHIRADIARHAAASEAAVTQARDDRRLLHGEIKELLEEIRAAGARIDAYEQQAKGGQRVLMVLGTLWGLATGSAGAFVMYWLKQNNTP